MEPLLSLLASWSRSSPGLRYSIVYGSHCAHHSHTAVFGFVGLEFFRKREYRLLKDMEYSWLMSWAMSRQVISASRNQDGNKAPKLRWAEGSELQGEEDRNVCSNKQIINGFLLHIHTTSSTWKKSGKILPLWANIAHNAWSIAFCVYKSYLYGCTRACTRMCMCIHMCIHPHIRNYKLHGASC